MKSYVEAFSSIIINKNGRIMYQKSQKMELMPLQNTAEHFNFLARLFLTYLISFLIGSSENQTVGK